MLSAGRHRAECTRLHLDSPGRRACGKRTSSCFVQREIHSNERQLARLRTAKRARLSERRLSACATVCREARLALGLDNSFDDDGDDDDTTTRTQSTFAAALDLHARTHDGLFGSPGADDDGFESTPATDDGSEGVHVDGPTLAAVTPIVCMAPTELAAPRPSLAPALSPVLCAALAALGARPPSSASDDGACVPSSREALGACGSGCDELTAALPTARMVFKTIPKAHSCLGRLYSAIVVGRLMYADADDAAQPGDPAGRANEAAQEGVASGAP
jgi:hypothetical protein